MACALYKARYGGCSIDVNTNGLLYWDSRKDYQAAAEQFDITAAVLWDLYTARKQSPVLDNISLDRGHVTSISVYCMSVYDALNMMWINIENNREPAVALCNFAVIANIRDPNISHRTDISLHYIVIAVVRKNNGVKEFYVLDPWYAMKQHWYTESEMKRMMEVDYRYPFWLWSYPSDPAKPGTPNPCYVGLVN